jgi:putative acetyltransferase
VILVRPFRGADAEALAAIFFAAVREVASHHYSQAQVEAWAPGLPDPASYIRKAGDGRAILVAVDGADQPLAYADLETDGHIDHIYCRPDRTRSGVAVALYEAIEALARGQGLRRLHVEASEPARRFFERRGFITLGRRDFAIRGVAIHNYRMEKRLAD